jgi:hypothetical protein
MSDEERRKETAQTWIERASFRLAECEAELRKRPAGGGKLAARSARYRDLVEDLRRTLGADDPLAPPPVEHIEHELLALKEKIFSLARDLVRAKEDLKELKLRWGATADEEMRRKEDRGLPPGRVPALDFRMPAPGPEAAPEDRAAHDVLRSLGL